MIVIKFPSSSLISGAAIRRAIESVKHKRALKPVLVVSAFGETIQVLLAAADEAESGHRYLARKRIADLQVEHFDQAAEVVSGSGLKVLGDSLAKHFSDLHNLIVEVCDDGRALTSALKEEIASYGGCFASEIFTAALNSAGVNSILLDAKLVFIANGQDSEAVSLYWKGYANLQRVVPLLAEHATLVIAGCMGSEESGSASHAGQRGADFTASAIAAATQAEQIQIWTDDDEPSGEPRTGLRRNSRRAATSVTEIGANIAVRTVLILS